MDKSTITDKPMQAVKYNPYEAIDNAAKSTKRQFGYKGAETAINGLLNFMDRLNRKHGINDKGKSVDRYDNNIKKIIEFGKMNHLLLLTTNRIDKDADLIAKKIDKRLMYSDFKNWYTNELLNQHPTHNG